MTDNSVCIVCGADDYLGIDRDGEIHCDKCCNHKDDYCEPLEPNKHSGESV